MTSEEKKRGWLSRVFGPALELGAYALEYAAMVGLISGAAIVAAYGKLLASAALLLLAFLCFLRIKRGRVNR